MASLFDPAHIRKGPKPPGGLRRVVKDAHPEDGWYAVVEIWEYPDGTRYLSRIVHVWENPAHYGHNCRTRP